MFQCEATGCNRSTKPNQPINRIVDQHRPTTYENVIVKGRRKGETYETHGREIMSETKVCPECYTLITGLKPAQAIKTTKPVVRESFKKQRPHREDKSRKKWSNKPRASKPSQKKPVVQVVNPLSSVPIVKG